MQLSSNIGISKIALGLGQRRLYEAFRRFGFGERPGLPVPSEAAGTLRPRGRPWVPVETAAAGLSWGADDMDGTISEERIAHLAGSPTPVGLARHRMEETIAMAGFTPVERDGAFRPLGVHRRQRAACTQQQHGCASNRRHFDAVSSRLVANEIFQMSARRHASKTWITCS